MNRMREARLTIDDFEHEAVSIDGTTAHALERFVAALVVDSGMSVIGADEVAGRLAAARARGQTGAQGHPGDTHAG
jgi:lipopolysaccharide biosynthesis protein